jgi:hypothetical protein
MCAIYTIYQGRLWLTEQLVTKEWDMIGSLGDKTTSGEIPRQYRAAIRQEAPGSEVALHCRVHEAGLKVQNNDKGFGKLVRKYERNEAMSATVALISRDRDDHGWAVYFTQGPRRCLLLDTVDRFTGDEKLCTALAAWATFKEGQSEEVPRQAVLPNRSISHLREVLGLLVEPG